MKVNLTTHEIEQQLAQDIALHMVGAMFAGPQHTYHLQVLFLSDSEKREFIQASIHLAETSPEFAQHFCRRIQVLQKRMETSSAILIVGLQMFGQPDGVDCGVCGYATCQEFYNPNRNLVRATVCPVELMSFSGSITRAMAMAHQMQTATLLAQSVGQAAILLKLVDASFAMGILLEVGQPLAIARENKMEIPTTA